MRKELNFEQSMERIEKLTRQMEQNEIGIDEMAKCLKEAQELIAYCKQRLCAVDEDIQKIINNE